jgi:hypothetical protein
MDRAERPTEAPETGRADQLALEDSTLPITTSPSCATTLADRGADRQRNPIRRGISKTAAPHRQQSLTSSVQGLALIQWQASIIEVSDLECC